MGSFAFARTRAAAPDKLPGGPAGGWLAAGRYNISKLAGNAQKTDYPEAAGPQSRCS